MTATDGSRIYQYRNNYYSDGTARNFLGLKNSKFIILYKPTNKIETNVEINPELTVENVRTYLDDQEGEKLYINAGEIQKAPDMIKQNWNYYKDFFNGSYYYSNGKYYNTKEEYEYMKKEIVVDSSSTIKTEIYEPEIREVSYVNYDIKDFEIYVTYEKEFIYNIYENYMLNIVKILSKYEDLLYISVPVCGIFSVIIVVYLIMAIGYKKNKEGFELNDIDKIPLEIVLGIIICIISLILLVTTNFYTTRPEFFKLYLSAIITAYFVIYILFAIGFNTVIKRIKAKILIKNTITWEMLKLCKKILIKIKGFMNSLIEKMQTTRKAVIAILGYLVLMIFITVIFAENNEIGMGIFFDLVITAIATYRVIKKFHSFYKIEEQLKNIYEGNNEERLNEEEFESEFKSVVQYINDISSGFENAVEEGIKSERLKTELITNVSHDIKTPLTSIINYVDLIKRENIENDKIKEYVEILEAKSHRLKRLTEDLVEASKASSGNVKLNLEKINLVELINQTTGEFEDKFDEKKLQIITDMPEEIFIEADSRYMYRIIENVFSNVSKYALSNSRVYVDLIRNENRVRIDVKNISEAKLNISEDELMQRFVRGDKSRYTEGSGLGLSISKSLAELQKGKFNIKIDGDLFKVEIEFEIKE